MNKVEVFMPKIDMDMKQGKFVRWYKQAGDFVEAGDDLFEIEGTKAAMDVEAHVSGVLTDVYAAPGDVFVVGQTIGYILEED
jgi:pyruvate dehydrogenase E2 component (dihydrolipoamide acetyltransferase)